MSSNRYKTMLLVLPVVFCVAGIFMVPDISDARQSFLKNDTDHDGRLSKDEFPGSDNAFDYLDKNGDGYIDKSEALKARKELSEKEEKGFFSENDKDHDGKLSKDEFPGSDEAFDYLDKNRDGYIDKAEALEVRKDASTRGGKDYFSENDKDHDGKLSKEEFSGSDKAFNYIDKNRDGYIDKDEVREARKARMKKGQNQPAD